LEQRNHGIENVVGSVFVGGDFHGRVHSGDNTNHEKSEESQVISSLPDVVAKPQK
jgi:hypothetical protein